MANLLLELFSEEIPARMQARAETQLGETLGKSLKEAGLVYETIETLSGPRRLTAHVSGLPERSEDVREERKGPRVGSPEQAVAGFLRGAGLSSIDEAEVRSDPKKGEFYVAIKETPGRPASDIIAEIIPGLVRNFHWPKSMRWGTGDLRWVRPLQRILCILDGTVVPFEVDGVQSGNETEGHRVHGRGPFTVTSLEDYKSQLEGEGHVRLARADRKALIANDARKVCADAGLELVEDEGLLEEVTGLAEWPNVILGKMDPAFLELPPEVIKLSMRTHQKYFAVRDPKSGELAPNFVVVANIEAADGGERIAEGNSRVLSARLEDGRFFWENDQKTGLEAMAAKLSTIDFKKELGSIADKVERVAALARDLAPIVGADPDQAERAARLVKADLVSEMVYEFPELQGVMGRYYAIKAGEDAAVADTIRDHYKPAGQSDSVPSEPISIAVALADRFDTLTGFWAINEKPTGSKDPFSLRRASLGVVRILLENDVRLELADLFLNELAKTINEIAWSPYTPGRTPPSNLNELVDRWIEGSTVNRSLTYFPEELRRCLSETPNELPSVVKISSDLLSFFADRLKQYLRDKGQRHDLIDAVFALGEDDLVLITKRVEALGAFLETEDGVNLLAGYKRAANILKIEEKKDGIRYEGDVDRNLIKETDEAALADALGDVVAAVDAALEKEDFVASMTALSKLRAPVDAFFDNVIVNADDSVIRKNRLLILAQLRDAVRRVAEFSLIEG